MGTDMLNDSSLLLLDNSPLKHSSRRRLRPRELGYCWGDNNYYDNHDIEAQVVRNLPKSGFLNSSFRTQLFPFFVGGWRRRRTPTRSDVANKRVKSLKFTTKSCLKGDPDLAIVTIVKSVSIQPWSTLRLSRKFGRTSWFGLSIFNQRRLQ